MALKDYEWRRPSGSCEQTSSTSTTSERTYSELRFFFEGKQKPYYLLDLLGTGKTHFSNRLGIKGFCEQGYQAKRFFSE